MRSNTRLVDEVFTQPYMSSHRGWGEGYLPNNGEELRRPAYVIQFLEMNILNEIDMYESLDYKLETK